MSIDSRIFSDHKHSQKVVRQPGHRPALPHRPREGVSELFHRHGLFLGALLHGLFRNILTGVRPLVCVYAGAPHLSTAGRQGARLLHGQLSPQARALVGDTRAGAAMTLMPPLSVDAGGS